jgi:hypothetical protein
VSVSRIGAAARRIAGLVARDPFLMMELACWRLLLPAVKRLVSVKTLARVMWRDPRGDVPRDRLVATIEIVSSSGRLFLSVNCLERSLVWYRVLSRAGAMPHLVMGARREERVDGHVWIELNGEPFGERDAERYVRLVSFGQYGREDPLAVPA